MFSCVCLDEALIVCACAYYIRINHNHMISTWHICMPRARFHEFIYTTMQCALIILHSQIASVPEAHTYNTFLFAANVTRACTDSVYHKTVLACNSPERVEKSLPVEK